MQLILEGCNGGKTSPKVQQHGEFLGPNLKHCANLAATGSSYFFSPFDAGRGYHARLMLWGTAFASCSAHFKIGERSRKKLASLRG